MKISEKLVAFDKYCDERPLLSTVNNLVALFIKCVILPFLSEETIKNNHYFKHLQGKSFTTCAWLLAPILGQIKVVEMSKSHKSPVDWENRLEFGGNRDESLIPLLQNCPLPSTPYKKIFVHAVGGASYPAFSNDGAFAEWGRPREDGSCRLLDYDPKDLSYILIVPRTREICRAAIKDGITVPPGFDRAFIDKMDVKELSEMDLCSFLKQHRLNERALKSFGSRDYSL